MNTGITIRRANEDDTSQIRLVLRESFLEFKSLYTEEAISATVATEEKLKLRLGLGPMWVACDNNKIIGSASCVEKTDELFIQGMGVLPAYRGQQIGYRLLIEIEKYARTRGISMLKLSTTPYLLLARNLYENFGFRIVNEGPYHLFRTPLFTMRKQLDLHK